MRGKNLVDEAWSGISVQLKRRHDLIPSLVNSVKGYMRHENEVFTNIAALRAQALSASSGSVEDVMKAESQLTGALRTLFALVENYPQLHANQNFMDLQNQLSVLEDEIQMSRRYYNGTAREQNNRVLCFPGNLVAGAFGFSKIVYFELDNETERAVPEVKFETEPTRQEPAPSNPQAAPVEPGAEPADTITTARPTPPRRKRLLAARRK